MAAELKIDTRKFEAALKTMLTQTKRDAEIVIREQAKGALKQIIEVTPPATGKVKGAKAFAMGKRAVAASISRVLVGVPVRVAEVSDEATMRAKHEANRRQGRVRRNLGSKRLRVPKTALAAYIKKRQAGVGRLAGGWGKAATKLGTKMPSYMDRHARTQPGYIKIKISNNGMSIKAGNRVDYASNVKGMERRIQYGLNAQAKAMGRRSKTFALKAFQKSGFKAGRAIA